jgi:hypothetical protein
MYEIYLTYLQSLVKKVEVWTDKLLKPKMAACTNTESNLSIAHVILKWKLHTKLIWTRIPERTKALV